MARDLQDDPILLRSLKGWLRDKPCASCVVAAIDPGENDELEISLQLSHLSAYQLIGLIQALLDHTIAIAEDVHGDTAESSTEVNRLRAAQATLDGASIDAPANGRRTRPAESGPSAGFEVA
jgi:hypothetical protein